MTLRTKFYCEVAIKNAVVLILSLWLFAPWVIRSQRELPSQLQGPVLSMMGFLMAAAIIGAFELTYSRTDLSVWYQRYLAHITKFLLYLGVILLIMIAITAMGATPGYFNDPIAFASILVLAALILHDVWDAIRAFSGRDA